ncbi:MAG: hypothetical protein FWG63_05295 [Defluviitaleaceae bacterium]|nr:hypothetical protein [Defluviitaleaceae bacterium]
MAMYIFEEDTTILFKEHFEKSAEEYRKFRQELCEKYPGWTVDFVYRNCDPPTEFMAEIGARILEAHAISNLTRETFNYANKPDATLVTTENFHIFEKLHESIDSDFAYPNAQIAKDMSRWRIFMQGNAYTMMSFWNDEPEIFILKASNAEEGALLLATAANYAFSNNIARLNFFIEVDKPIEMEAAQKVGFTVSGRSIAYRVDSLKS